jgi:hypothetical protein
MIDGLMGLPSSKGTVIFVCGKCGVLPEHAFGADDKKRLVHLLVCPKCLKLLGEWTSPEERTAELKDFSTKVEALNKPKATEVFAKGRQKP